jgi:transposase InsO family protein
MSPRTLRDWRRRWEADRLAWHSRGRPPTPCDAATRNQVVRFLHQVTGPAVGLPALRPLFPQVSRCILEDLLRRYRRVWRHRYCRKGYRLTWHVPGTVWAMDFSEAPHPIDGVYGYLFAVRDLASHYQLAWQPVENERAETVLPLLQDLFQEHGPPLVLKSDQGSAFIAQVLGLLMDRCDVAQLFSPPRTPRYNGAVERSNGTLKTYTGLHAIHEGHPFRWTSDDVEHARQLANTISRPWGHKGATPDEAWQVRPAIDTNLRQTFVEQLNRNRPQATIDLGLTDLPFLSASNKRQLDRLAISRTLEQLGYLSMKRTRRRKRQRKEQARAKSSRVSDTSMHVECSRTNGTSTRSPVDPTVRDIRAHQITVLESAGHRKQKQTKRLLAQSVERVTMTTATEKRIDLCTDVRIRGSPHGERSICSWLRRLFTPLLRIKKPASITW